MEFGTEDTPSELLSLRRLKEAWWSSCSVSLPSDPFVEAVTADVDMTAENVLAALRCHRLTPPETRS